ncbi:hypothetical protein D3P07_19525 [Paenibacillus sp. 1011MAR3C5]|uniref:MauE/DoxX family redox-associated membrane protein n=1 Tax=Paenibacillus sp. 1011MAR3C5 TaxID=1675787 RepID=UPI000E6D4CA7|nr:MauE/DoxX family redox-associated membrane protein [Paenibacillus sp. 1011MAR3C5]RJE86265.1 hypothetical protein D3P07_19525 [Paenibacillus sp. 1011MAR3C5]
MHVLAYGTDMLLAAMFFLAAFSKLGAFFADFRLSIAAYRVLPRQLLSLAAGSVLAAEFALCLLYGFGLLHVWKDLFAVLLFAGFTIMLFRKRRLQESDDTSCSCFGKIEVLNKYPVVRNVILMLLAGGRMALPDRVPADMDAAVLSLTGLTIIVSGTMLWELYSSLKRSKEITIDL